MSFQSRLKDARLIKGYTQEELANIIGVAKSTYTGYEKGNREPNMLTVSKIMDALEIDANFLWQDEMDAIGGSSMKLKYDEKQLIEKYRFISECSPQGKEFLDNVLNREYSMARQLQDKDNRIAKLETILTKPVIPLRIYTYMRKIAAAGTGFYFDDIPTDTIEAPFLENADFIIGVSGDSMEPTYSDGDLVYVEKCQTIETGSIGIFILNKECFIKEAGKDGLISHNQKYDTIPGSSDIICVGKVLGKVNLG